MSPFRSPLLALFAAAVAAFLPLSTAFSPAPSAVIPSATRRNPVAVVFRPSFAPLFASEEEEGEGEGGGFPPPAANVEGGAAEDAGRRNALRTAILVAAGVVAGGTAGGDGGAALAASSASASASASPPYSGPTIDVNNAMAREFTAFPGLYPTIATKIVNGAKDKPYATKGDVYAVLTSDLEIERLKQYDSAIVIGKPDPQLKQFKASQICKYECGGRTSNAYRDGQIRAVQAGRMGLD